MFHTLTNVQDSAAVRLQQCIDNKNNDVRVGLRQITYTVGWYNVKSRQEFSWRRSGDESEKTLYIAPGLYSFEQLYRRLKQAAVYPFLRLYRIDGLVTMRIPDGLEFHFTDGLLSLLGLDDGLDGEWLGSGTYTGDRVVNFAGSKLLQVHLDTLSTTGNFVDGNPSTLLAVVGVRRYVFGDTVTVRFEPPEFKHLINGDISELKIIIRDDTGKHLDNHNLAISVVLEFQRVK